MLGSGSICFILVVGHTSGHDIISEAMWKSEIVGILIEDLW